MAARLRTSSSDARRQGAASLIGVLAAMLLVLHAHYTLQAIMPSYLFVWLFLFGLSLGSMALLFVHNLTGGVWGDLVRPVLQALVRMLPYCALLAIPLLLRQRDLYLWMEPNEGGLSNLRPGQEWYLNVPFFYVRWFAYFGIWITLGVLLGKPSARRSSDATAAPAARSQLVSALGLLLYLLTTTFASFDWTMALTPQWYSTEFGLLTAIGQCLSALAFAVVAVAMSKSAGSEILRPGFHDLGNLLLALVLFWAYLAFMQFLIMWIEDLPRDISWYLPRAEEGWRGLSLFLVCLHFALPFLLLLSRRLKRAPMLLGGLAAVLLLGGLADTFWLVIPAFRPQHFELRWTDLLTFVALSGVWSGLFLRALSASNAGPLLAPAVEPAIRHA